MTMLQHGQQRLAWFKADYRGRGKNMNYNFSHMKQQRIQTPVDCLLEFSNERYSDKQR